MDFEVASTAVATSGTAGTAGTAIADLADSTDSPAAAGTVGVAAGTAAGAGGALILLIDIQSLLRLKTSLNLRHYIYLEWSLQLRKYATHGITRTE